MMQTAYTSDVLKPEDITAKLAAIREGITTRRELKKLSQRALERKSGVDQPVISRIEKDTTPDLATLLRLVDGLDLTMSAFFLQIEGGQKEGLPSRPESSQDEPASPQGPDDHSVSTPVAAVIFKRFLADLAKSYPEAVARTTGHRPVPSVKPKKTARRKPAPRVAGHLSRK